MLIDLRNFPVQIVGTSQKGQDSIIREIVNAIHPEVNYCVEFGAYNGVDFLNCYDLIHTFGWGSLLLDVEFSNPHINLYKEHLTSGNILDIFHKYKVPKKIGLLSIDIDGNDYWLLKEIIKEYESDIIIVECNSRFSIHESMAQKYNPIYFWDGKSQYGASLLALVKLLTDYSLVHLHLDDAFFVRKSKLIENNLETLKLVEIHPEPNFTLYESHNSPMIDLSKWVEV